MPPPDPSSLFVVGVVLLVSVLLVVLLPVLLVVLLVELSVPLVLLLAGAELQVWLE